MLELLGFAETAQPNLLTTEEPCALVAQARFCEGLGLTWRSYN